MKLIIDIPQEVYSDTVRMINTNGGSDDIVDNAIYAGTPISDRQREIIEELKNYPDVDSISLVELIKKINEIIRIVNKENA